MLSDIFIKMDVSNTGYLCKHDIKISLEMAGQCSCNSKTVDRLMMKLDKDGSGHVEFDEFVKFYYLTPLANLETAFEYWDSASTIDNGEGFRDLSTHDCFVHKPTA